METTDCISEYVMHPLDDLCITPPLEEELDLPLHITIELHLSADLDGHIKRTYTDPYHEGLYWIVGRKDGDIILIAKNGHELDPNVFQTLFLDAMVGTSISPTLSRTEAPVTCALDALQYARINLGPPPVCSIIIRHQNIRYDEAFFSLDLNQTYSLRWGGQLGYSRDGAFEVTHHANERAPRIEYVLSASVLEKATTMHNFTVRSVKGGPKEPPQFIGANSAQPAPSFLMMVHRIIYNASYIPDIVFFPTPAPTVHHVGSHTYLAVNTNNCLVRGTLAYKTVCVRPVSSMTVRIKLSWYKDTVLLMEDCAEVNMIYNSRHSCLSGEFLFTHKVPETSIHHATFIVQRFLL